MSPWLGIALVLGSLGALAGGLKLLEPRLGNPELARKGLHVGIGLVACSFPWLFSEAWPVLTLAGATVAALLLVKLTPALRGGVGSVLHGVDRDDSLGDVLFPVAVAALFVGARQAPVFYLIPMLMLTLADAAAALVGVRYGLTQMASRRSAKSVEGAIAFFAVAFMVIHVPLLLMTEVGRAESLLIAAILALLMMMVESAAWSGLDNLFVPLVGHALLRLYVSLPTEALLLRLGLTAALGLLVLLSRRRTNLDDAALVLCLLYAYAAAMLGGWPWLLAPVSLFVYHQAMWPRKEQGAGRFNSVFAALAVVGAGAAWLAVQLRGGEGLLPAAVSFAVHGAVACISDLDQPSWRASLARGALGWLLFALPTQLLGSPRPLALLAAGGGAVAGALLFQRCYAPLGPASRRLWVSGLACAAAAFGSLLTWAATRSL